MIVLTVLWSWSLSAQQMESYDLFWGYMQGWYSAEAHISTCADWLFYWHNDPPYWVGIYKSYSMLIYDKRLLLPEKNYWIFVTKLFSSSFILFKIWRCKRLSNTFSGPEWLHTQFEGDILGQNYLFFTRDMPPYFCNVFPMNSVISGSIWGKF